VEHLLLFGKKFTGISSPQPSSSRITEARTSSSSGGTTTTHSQTRVIGLRDQAAEQALIQHSTSKQQKTFAEGLLPIRASEIVFHKMCEKWRDTEQTLSPEEIDNGLQPFYQGQICPVANLDLSNVQITDRILAALLVNQRSTLTSLSLISTKVNFIIIQ
jgi:hypothetical protein